MAKVKKGENRKEKTIEASKLQTPKSSEYLLHMSKASKLGTSASWLALIPVILFSAITILIVRAFTYERDMEQFYWTNEANALVDFFSYGKMILIFACAAIALFVLLCRAVDRKMFIRKSYIYIPMVVYALFVIISFALSEYKEFSLLGYNGRFEGTLVILSYLVMLFYIINTVNSEKNIKLILTCVGISVTALGLLGITQGTGHDFFRTTIGKKLITPTSMWGGLDELNFTFQNNEIYQTVFNINYVSFYLALIIPIFAMIMIYTINNKSDKWIPKCIAMIALFALLLYNLVGSVSAGGIAGLAIAFIVALILFNKRLLKWWKAIVAMLLVMLVIFGLTFNLWSAQLGSTFSGMKADNVNDAEIATDAVASKVHIDHMVTDGNLLRFSVNGNELKIQVLIDPATGVFEGLDVQDADSNALETNAVEVDGMQRYFFTDERYKDAVHFYLTQDDDLLFLVMVTGEQQWPYVVTTDGLYYRNELGKITEVGIVPAYGFINRQDFGSGRGYIWSRTLGMVTDNILIGDGADTYCLNYPHNDYAGKYNTKTFDINIIVDKPHNMYLGMWQGTGAISMLAFIAMMIIYIMQSVKVLKNNKYDTWLDYVASGLFLGVIGFLVGGIFNDSTVSTMPLFYSMVGIGIVANQLIMAEKAE